MASLTTTLSLPVTRVATFQFHTHVTATQKRVAHAPFWGCMSNIRSLYVNSFGHDDLADILAHLVRDKV